MILQEKRRLFSMTAAVHLSSLGHLNVNVFIERLQKFAPDNLRENPKVSESTCQTRLLFSFVDLTRVSKRSPERHLLGGI